MAEFIHPFRRSVARGLAGHCPNCGKGALYRRYLKVNGRCAACGHELGRYPADDGPAYVTILVVGHLVVAPLLLFPIIWRSNPLYSLPIILTALTVLVLALLPRIKGGWIGLMYSLGVRDSDAHLHTADAAD